MYTATTATKRVMKMRKRIRLLAGGMRASKTVSVLLYLIDDAQTDKVATLTSVVSESMPHLRRGAIRDFESIMKQHKYWRDGAWNASTFTYTFQSGSKIEFFSADQPSKIRGPSRDRLFVNEANNIAQESWEQLLYRTREYAFADWNPVADFYMYEDYGLHDSPKIMATDDRVDFIILTYKDNEALEDTIVYDIEKKAEVNPGWARVYAKGLRGDMEGKIFSDWAIIDEIPHEARLEIRGADFGFSIDPTVLVDIYYYNGGYIIDELVYRTNFYDTDFGTYVMNAPNPNTLIIGDSADKQKIQILQNMGLPIIGVDKRGSSGDTFTNSAIKFVQGQRMSITKRSINTIKSYRNFMWQTDKDGKIRTNPSKYDHYLSDGMMAVIYGMTNFNMTRREDESLQPTMTGNITSLWG